MTLCTERALVKHDGALIHASPLRCKRWSCPYCGPRRVKDLQQRALQNAPTIFLTLTVRKGQYATPEAQAQEMAMGWRMLRQYLMRTLGRDSLPFLAVFEKHKSGWPHLHIILRTNYIHHSIIREWWVKRFNSPVIDIQRIQSAKRAAEYVSKYISSEPHLFTGVKRYWCSQDWILPQNKRTKTEWPEEVWFETFNCTMKTLIQLALIDGAKITLRGSHLSVEHWDPYLRQRWGLG